MSVAAAAAVSGALAPSTYFDSRSSGQVTTFVSISNAASVFRIALSANSSSSVGIFAGPASSNAYTTLQLLAQPVDMFGNIGGPSYFADLEYNVSGSGAPTRSSACFVANCVVGESLNLLVAGNYLNANGVFAYTMYADAHADNNNYSVTQDINNQAYATIFAPNITLYDVNNQDVTALHSIALDYDPNAAVAAPEPGSLVLVVTGVAGMLGVVRRRRTFAS